MGGGGLLLSVSTLRPAKRADLPGEGDPCEEVAAVGLWPGGSTAAMACRVLSSTAFKGACGPTWDLSGPSLLLICPGLCKSVSWSDDVTQAVNLQSGHILQTAATPP